MARAGGITNAVNVGIAVQADWENREFISHISLNVRRLFEFLVQFEATTKSKLALLNEKLDTLERRLELLEVQLPSAWLVANVLMHFFGACALNSFSKSHTFLNAPVGVRQACQ